MQDQHYGRSSKGGRSDRSQEALLAANRPVTAYTDQNYSGQATCLKPVESYEKTLQHARQWACIIAFLHAFCQFLSFCIVTFGTVAVLGGDTSAFASSLGLLHFVFVTCLLLLEGGRLVSTAFFMHLPLRALAYGSQDPKKINHGKDGHYVCSRCTRIACSIIQAILAIPSLALPTIGLLLLHGSSTPRFHNLQLIFLSIFYSFVAFNSLVALLNVTCSACACASLVKPPEQSILRYFSTVLQNATIFGLAQADDFEFFRFK